MNLFLKDYGTKEELFSLVYKVKHRVLLVHQFYALFSPPPVHPPESWLNLHIPHSPFLSKSCVDIDTV